MKHTVEGLHHVTAIASDPQKNYDFYTQVLGMRLVKTTVNFDDPQTYHFYFGDGSGTPGTLLTFFPMPGVRPGRRGTGMATEIGLSVPAGSLDYWKNRFEARQVPYGNSREKFGEQVLPFTDPDGLKLELVVPGNPDPRQGWTHVVDSPAAIRGFHYVNLALQQKRETAALLEDVFDYRLVAEEGRLSRYVTPHATSAATIDLLELPHGERGINAGGTNHHIAFRVKDEETLMRYREKIVDRGLYITEKINRDYFYSLYFREPGGVLFEIATDNPGFMTDEPLESLGTTLQLPQRYQSMKADIEKALPPLQR